MMAPLLSKGLCGLSVIEVDFHHYQYNDPHDFLHRHVYLEVIIMIIMSK